MLCHCFGLCRGIGLGLSLTAGMPRPAPPVRLSTFEPQNRGPLNLTTSKNNLRGFIHTSSWHHESLLHSSTLRIIVLFPRVWPLKCTFDAVAKDMVKLASLAGGSCRNDERPTMQHNITSTNESTGCSRMRRW